MMMRYKWALLLLVSVAAGARLDRSSSVGQVHGISSPAGHGVVECVDNCRSFVFLPSTKGANDDGPAWGSYTEGRMHPSGFGHLKVYTSGAYSDRVQLQAAGFLEGYLTAGDIFNSWYNTYWYINQRTNDSFALMGWLQQQYDWVQQQLSSAQRESEDPYWQSLDLVMAQLDGVMQGYNARVMAGGPQVEGLDFLYLRAWLVIQAMGDVLDLLPKLFPENPSVNPTWEHLNPSDLLAELSLRGHCSALIKVTPDLTDILVGHTSWFTYTSMIRIYKHYNFQVKDDAVRSRQISMASYPGMISSMDDFYILGGSNLVVMETTNTIFNRSLYDLVKPQAVLNWQRVRIANFLASSGPDWVQWFSRHNSGTYNNQYMVLDLKRFTPGQELKLGLLTVVEQIPGLIESEDRTQDLERGYWPSYNVPFFPAIYNLSGWGEMKRRLTTLGDAYLDVLSGFSYQLAPRAKIMRRDVGEICDLDSMKRFLRYNDYEYDHFSQHNPWNAICSRGDLDKDKPRAAGCTDTKVTSYQLALQLTAEVVNGPTHQGQPAFSWGQGFDNVAHRGMPDVYDYQYERMMP